MQTAPSYTASTQILQALFLNPFHIIIENLRAPHTIVVREYCKNSNIKLALQPSELLKSASLQRNVIIRAGRQLHLKKCSMQPRVTASV